MEHILQRFLLFLFACLPAFMYRPFKRKRFGWCFLPCSIIGAVLSDLFPRPSLLFYALLLGLCLFFVLYKPLEKGKLIGFFLSWNGGIAVLSVGHLLHITASSSLTPWFVLLFALALSLSFGLVAHWLSRWTTEDTVRLSEETQISPLPPLILVSVLLLLLAFFGERSPIGCVFLSIVLQALQLMILSLWSNMALSVRHSQESSEDSRRSRHLIDHANRSSEAELQRKLTESNNKLQQMRLAYQNNDQEMLTALLELSAESDGCSYTTHLMLDAILRHRAQRAREAGLLTNFQLQLGNLRDFSLSDVSVLVDLMLGLMIEPHPGKSDTLRLRMQEWGDALIVVVGRRDSLHTVPETKMNTLLQLTEEYHGWMEFSEKDRGICLSAVLFRPTSEK